MRAGDTVGERFVLREDLAPAGTRRNVWHAYDQQLRRDVVLKDVSGASEPVAMAKLTHPHVITVYERHPIQEDRYDAGDWMVQEYAPGGSLAGQRRSPTEAAKIGAQVAKALVYMHARGLVHCDIKPGNIVLAEDGTAKLTDFGSAYRFEPTNTPQPSNTFTWGYAASEHTEGVRTPAADVRALAATVYALVMGVPPAQAHYIPNERLGPLNRVLPEMLHPDPSFRPDATQAQWNLQAIADERPPEGLPVGAEPTVPPTGDLAPEVPQDGTSAALQEQTAASAQGTEGHRGPTGAPLFRGLFRGRAWTTVPVSLATTLITLVLLAAVVTATPIGQRVGVGLWAPEEPSPTHTVTAAAPARPSVSRTPNPNLSPSQSSGEERGPIPTDPPRSTSPTNTKRPVVDSCQRRELYQVTEKGEVVRDDPDESIGSIAAGDYFMRTSRSTPPEPLDDRHYGTMTSGQSDGVTGYVLQRKLAFVREICA